MYVCMHVYICVCVCIETAMEFFSAPEFYPVVCTCVCVCVYVCMYVCMHMCVCIETAMTFSFCAGAEFYPVVCPCVYVCVCMYTHCSHKHAIIRMIHTHTYTLSHTHYSNTTQKLTYTHKNTSDFPVPAPPVMNRLSPCSALLTTSSCSWHNVIFSSSLSSSSS